MLYGFWELVKIPPEPEGKKSHLEKRSSKINFQHIHAKARAKLKLDGLFASWEIGLCFGVWGTWKYTFVGRENGVSLASLSLWMNETTLYLQGILMSPVVHTDSLGHTGTGGKWIMLLNALNQGLNLVLLSASLSIFTCLGSYVKALLSTTTTHYLAISTCPGLTSQST